MRLFEGVRCPLADRKPGDIDFMIVRENNEGEYSEIGGRLYAGHGGRARVSSRICLHPDRASTGPCALPSSWPCSRPAKHLTSATKSNGIIHTMPYWDERFAAVGADYPGDPPPTSITSIS